MQFDLQKAVETIKNNKDFLKLKNVIENNAGHDHEPVYDHCVKTYEIARKTIDGHFIENNLAKEKLENYLNTKVDGIEKRDLFQITALIHDIGKMIVFEESGKTKNLLFKIDDENTFAPEHGYWGSLIVADVTSDLGFSDEIIAYLSKCVRLHLAGFNFWYDKELSLDELLWKIKLRSENIHVEVIFSTYADLYYGNHFKDNIQLPVALLNKPEAYNLVEYSTRS